MGRRQAFLRRATLGALAALCLAGSGAAQDLEEQLAADRAVRVEVRTPTVFVPGEPFVVEVDLVAPKGGGSVPVWAVSAAAFELDGSSLGLRPAEVQIPLVGGQSIHTRLDLGRDIQQCPNLSGRDFRLTYAAVPGAPPASVYYLERAERGMDFMQLPRPQLPEYDVVLETVHGPIWIELWPDVAPNHVRNFLDLAYIGFYDDTDFYRVMPGFMIQAGKAKAGQTAPRRLKNEFNDRRHVPGVLSMARLSVDIPDSEGKVVPQFDSATSEFFLVHKISPSLDGKYTAFGRVVEGMEVVEAITDSVKDQFNPRDERTHKPKVRQTILKAIVVKAPPRRPGQDR